jgi:hypothetical protein
MWTSEHIVLIWLVIFRLRVALHVLALKCTNFTYNTALRGAKERLVVLLEQLHSSCASHVNWSHDSTAWPRQIHIASPY